MREVALVTGGLGGIGTVICQEFIDQGYTVYTTCLDFEVDGAEEWRRDNFHVDMGVPTVIPCDVAYLSECERLAEEIGEDVDVVVNAAGITRDGFFHKSEVENWLDVIDINLTSVYNVTRQFINGMRERGDGRIINISSVNGQTGQFGQTNYSAAKAGMHGFTMALAKESAPKGVTVNTVSPGYVRTPMTDKMPDKVREQIISQIPTGRLAEPQEIATVVAFLASDDAQYINGANIPVNGALFCSF